METVPTSLNPVLDWMYPSEQPHLDTAGGSYRCRAAHAGGVSSASRWMFTSAMPGSTPARYSRIGIFSRLQVSTMDMIAATFGPACLLPT